MPAWAAGVSSSGAITLTTPFSMVTSRPIPPNLAAGLDIELLHFLGVHIARMRIKRGEHAVDRASDQLPLIWYLDGLREYEAIHLSQEVEFRIVRADPICGSSVFLPGTPHQGCLRG